MKFIKWKSLIITCLVCLLPVLFGIALWNELPERVAIHFNFNNQPDNFSSKGFAVFGLPLMMAMLQIICCIINDINASKHGNRPKFERVTKWITPVLSIVLQIVTLGYALGWNIDIRKSVAVIISIIFIAIGNYLPKLDYVKNKDMDTDKARKINRFIGYETIIMGILSFITVFLPPASLIIWLFLFIPYVVIGLIYSRKA